MHRILSSMAVAALTLSGAAMAQDALFAREIKARQGIMNYRALNLGALGAMAKGEAEYDAATAQRAADALAAAASIDQSMLWPQGSDNSANPDTRALAKIWEEGSEIPVMAKALVDATTAMQAAAGVDLASLQGAMQGVAEACGACHKAYRESTN